MRDRAFVFGYGSLTLLDGVVPIREPRPEGFVTDLPGFARAWGVAMDNRRDLPGYKYYVAAGGRRPAVYVSFLDVHERPDATVNGVCLPVDAARLAALDRRERNYTRVDVSDRVAAGGARVWVYAGSAAGRERFATGRTQGRAVISAGYLRQVQAGFWRLGEDEYAACRASLDPDELPVLDLTRVDLAPPPMSADAPPGLHDITTPPGRHDIPTLPGEEPR